MSIPPALLSAFPPSADLLFDLARRRTDDAMLHDIAVADYGMGSDEALAALRPVRDRGVIPDPLPWVLHEVLTLTHFCNPDVPNPPPFDPGPTGLRGHQTRLFACAALLRIEAGMAPGESDIASDSALAQCLVSAKVLGAEMSEAAACYLTWRISRRERDPESLLCALGLLVLATRLRHGRLTEPGLGVVADWVLETEWRDRRGFPPMEHAGPRPRPFSIQSGFWEPLAAELRAEAESLRDADARTGLQLCALLLDPDDC